MFRVEIRKFPFLPQQNGKKAGFLRVNTGKFDSVERERERGGPWTLALGSSHLLYPVWRFWCRRKGKRRDDLDEYVGLKRYRPTTRNSSRAVGSCLFGTEADRSCYLPSFIARFGGRIDCN